MVTNDNKYVAWLVPLVEQGMFAFPRHLNSHPRFVQSFPLVFCVVFCGSLSLLIIVSSCLRCAALFYHCIVLSSMCGSFWSLYRLCLRCEASDLYLCILKCFCVVILLDEQSWILIWQLSALISLFVLLSFLIWPLCCLSFFNLWLLITSVVSSNFSWKS